MIRFFLLTLLLVLFFAPCASAGETTELLEQQIGLEELERAGEGYIGETNLSERLDTGSILHHVGEQGIESLHGILKSSIRSCVLLLAVTLLCGLMESMKSGLGGDEMGITTLAAVLSISAIATGDVHSLLDMGEEAIFHMETLGDVLFPAVSMATAVSGFPTAAAAKHSATILFSDLLIRLIEHVLIPLCYTFIAAFTAWAALGNDGLKRIAGFIKWLIVTMLSILLLAFIGYLNLTGVISGSADAATVKAAKFTISNMVPVVGGVISDTAETLLAGAAVLRNTVGIFGMLVVLGICLVPFLNLGIHYLIYKCTAALAAVVSGDGRVTAFIDALGTAFGLILAMTGSCAMLLIVAMISTVSAAAG